MSEAELHGISDGSAVHVELRSERAVSLGLSRARASGGPGSRRLWPRAATLGTPLALLLSASHVEAQEGATQRGVARSEAAQMRPESAPPDADPPLPPDQRRRPTPDYGAPPQQESWASVALWVPRILLAPAYVASDLVGRPLWILGTLAEKQRWRARIYEVLTFGVHDQIGVFPTGRIDSGFSPSLGVYSFWNDVWRHSNLRARVTNGGARLWTGSLRWRLPIGEQTLAAVVEFNQRPDNAFHGLGPESPARAGRYAERRFEARLWHRSRPAPDLQLTFVFGQRWLAFDASPAAAGGMSLAEAVADGRLASPPAFDGGLLALYAGLYADLDTRRGRLTPNPRIASDFEHVSGSGFSVRAFVEQHAGLKSTRAVPGATAEVPVWLSFGSHVTGTLDATGTQRRVDLELYAAFSEPLPGRGEVPFTEQVTLGGSRPMRGFGQRRLTDRSAAVATLRYRWPVWSTLDGMLHYAVGNVFGPRLEGFAPRLFRPSFGIGVLTAAESDHPFEILLAFGGETFAAGGAIENTRLAVGTTANF